MSLQALTGLVTGCLTYVCSLTGPSLQTCPRCCRDHDKQMAENVSVQAKKPVFQEEMA